VAQLSAILPRIRRVAAAIYQRRKPSTFTRSAISGAKCARRWKWELLVQGGSFKGNHNFRAGNCTAQLESYDRRYSLLCVLLAKQVVTEIEPFSRADCWDGVSWCKIRRYLFGERSLALSIISRALRTIRNGSSFGMQVQCPCCCQELRLPDRPGRIHAKCPSCNSRFICQQ